MRIPMSRYLGGRERLLCSAVSLPRTGHVWYAPRLLCGGDDRYGRRYHPRGRARVRGGGWRRDGGGAPCTIIRRGKCPRSSRRHLTPSILFLLPPGRMSCLTWGRRSTGLHATSMRCHRARRPCESMGRAAHHLREGRARRGGERTQRRRGMRGRARARARAAAGGAHSRRGSSRGGACPLRIPGREMRKLREGNSSTAWRFGGRYGVPLRGFL